MIEEAATIDPEAFRTSLRAWYLKQHRDLPWRRTRDPYAIWISEIMLQQTTVEAVIPHYHRFLARFPDVHALARASEDDVLHAWSGLGYYRRARHLHAAARAIASDHGGSFPCDMAAALALPGIGRYTAGAVLSFAFDRPLPIVDANIARVLARLVLIEAPLGSAHANEQLWAAAARLVPQHDPATHNQALMELGARLCTPADPQCPSCPVELHCAARRLGRAHELPRARPRKATQDLRLAGVILARADHIVLRRRPEQERLGGQWEIPATELVAAARSQDVVQQMLRGLGATIKGSAMHVGTVRHAILHYRIRLDVYHAPLRRWHAAADGATLLLGARQRAQLPITTLTRKAMRLLPALEGER